MAWVEFHAAKIKRLQKFRDFRIELGWSVNEALGFLGSLWGEAIELCESGNISGWKPEYIAEITCMGSFDSRRLWDALVTYRWIDLVDGKVLLHDWLDTAGTYLIKKYSTSNRAKLVEIWRIHGLEYGKRPNSDRIATLPNLTLPNQPTNIKGSAFAPPTIDEVLEHCRTRGSPVDALKFHAYYSANGWRVGRNPMKNWKAAVVTWERNIREAPSGR